MKSPRRFSWSPFFPADRPRWSRYYGVHESRGRFACIGRRWRRPDPASSDAHPAACDHPRGTGLSMVIVLALATSRGRFPMVAALSFWVRWRPLSRGSRAGRGVFTAGSIPTSRIRRRPQRDLPLGPIAQLRARQRAFALAVTYPIEPLTPSTYSQAVDQLAFHDGKGRLLISPQETSRRRISSKRRARIPQCAARANRPRGTCYARTAGNPRGASEERFRRDEEQRAAPPV